MIFVVVVAVLPLEIEFYCSFEDVQWVILWDLKLILLYHLAFTGEIQSLISYFPSIFQYDFVLDFIDIN